MAKVKYKKKFDVDVRSTNSGSKFINEYSYVYDEDGYKHLEISGKKNIFNEIQANKDYCDIGMMVERFLAGDPEALNRIPGFYADLTDAPKTYMEMVQRVEESRNAFERLDTDIKKVFGNNPDEFWSLYGTDEFYERLGKYEAEKVVIETEKEMKSEDGE